MWIGTNGECKNEIWYIVLYNRDIVLDIWLGNNILVSIGNNIYDNEFIDRDMGSIDILDDIDDRIYIWISRRSTRDIKGKKG